MCPGEIVYPCIGRFTAAIELTRNPLKGLLLRRRRAHSWVLMKSVARERAEEKSRAVLQSGFLFNLAATYSRGSYTTTTIGKAAFDGRVRNGIGSVHSFMTTKNLMRCKV